MQTLTAHLISQEVRPHRRPRPIERISVGIHWRVERLTRLHQVGGVLVVEDHMTLLVQAEHLLVLLVANDDWHLLVHCWEVTGRIGGDLKGLAVELLVHWGHALVETVHFLRWHVAVVSTRLMLVLQIDLVLKLEEWHNIYHLVLIEAEALHAGRYSRPCHHLASSTGGCCMLHKNHLL